MRRRTAHLRAVLPFDEADGRVDDRARQFADDFQITSFLWDVNEYVGQESAAWPRHSRSHG